MQLTKKEINRMRTVAFNDFMETHKNELSDIFNGRNNAICYNIVQGDKVYQGFFTSESQINPNTLENLGFKHDQPIKYDVLFSVNRQTKQLYWGGGNITECIM